jgi:hypothetical protein
MTDDEKRQQKAMPLLDYQEAEDNLAHTKERASRIGSMMKRGRRVDESPEWKLPRSLCC